MASRTMYALIEKEDVRAARADVDWWRETMASWVVKNDISFADRGAVRPTEPAAKINYFKDLYAALANFPMYAVSQALADSRLRTKLWPVRKWILLQITDIVTRICRKRF